MKTQSQVESDLVEEREGALRLAQLEKAKSILDLGTCGCACMTMVLAEKGFQITTVDKSEEELAEAKKYAKENGLLHRINFLKEDANKLSFPAHFFDAVFAYYFLHHCEDPKKVISEMFRVCKQGGKIVVAEPNAAGRERMEHQKDRTFLKKVHSILKRNAPKVEAFDYKYTRVWIVSVH